MVDSPNAQLRPKLILTSQALFIIKPLFLEKVITFEEHKYQHLDMVWKIKTIKGFESTNHKKEL